jgi:hypothetical protein
MLSAQEKGRQHVRLLAFGEKIATCNGYADSDRKTLGASPFKMTPLSTRI